MSDFQFKIKAVLAWVRFEDSFDVKTNSKIKKFGALACLQKEAYDSLSIGIKLLKKDHKDYQYALKEIPEKYKAIKKVLPDSYKWCIPLNGREEFLKVYDNKKEKANGDILNDGDFVVVSGNAKANKVNKRITAYANKIGVWESSKYEIASHDEDFFKDWPEASNEKEVDEFDEAFAEGEEI